MQNDQSKNGQPVSVGSTGDSASGKLTPMMQRYDEVKSRLPKDTLLLFRVGNFYELFFDDAVTASRVLKIPLTKRQDRPMAGVPYHAVDRYIAQLRAAGHAVAVCDKATEVFLPNTTSEPQAQSTNT